MSVLSALKATAKLAVARGVLIVILGVGALPTGALGQFGKMPEPGPFPKKLADEAVARLNSRQMDMVVVLKNGKLGDQALGFYLKREPEKALLEKLGTFGLPLGGASLAPLDECKSFSAGVPHAPRNPNSPQYLSVCVAVPTMAQFSNHQDQVNAALKALPEHIKTFEIIQALQKRISDLERDVASLRAAKK